MQKCEHFLQKYDIAKKLFLTNKVAHRKLVSFIVFSNIKICFVLYIF